MKRLVSRLRGSAPHCFKGLCLLAASVAADSTLVSADEGLSPAGGPQTAGRPALLQPGPHRPLHRHAIDSQFEQPRVAWAVPQDNLWSGFAVPAAYEGSVEPFDPVTALEAARRRRHIFDVLGITGVAASGSEAAQPHAPAPPAQLVQRADDSTLETTETYHGAPTPARLQPTPAQSTPPAADRVRPTETKTPTPALTESLYQAGEDVGREDIGREDVGREDRETSSVTNNASDSTTVKPADGSSDGAAASNDAGRQSVTSGPRPLTAFKPMDIRPMIGRPEASESLSQESHGNHSPSENSLPASKVVDATESHGTKIRDAVPSDARVSSETSSETSSAVSSANPSEASDKRVDAPPRSSLSSKQNHQAERLQPTATGAQALEPSGGQSGSLLQPARIAMAVPVMSESNESARDLPPITPIAAMPAPKVKSQATPAESSLAARPSPQPSSSTASAPEASTPLERSLATAAPTPVVSMSEMPSRSPQRAARVQLSDVASNAKVSESASMPAPSDMPTPAVKPAESPVVANATPPSTPTEAARPSTAEVASNKTSDAITPKLATKPSPTSSVASSPAAPSSESLASEEPSPATLSPATLSPATLSPATLSPAPLVAAPLASAPPAIAESRSEKPEASDMQDQALPGQPAPAGLRPAMVAAAAPSRLPANSSESAEPATPATESVAQEIAEANVPEPTSDDFQESPAESKFVESRPPATLAERLQNRDGAGEDERSIAAGESDLAGVPKLATKRAAVPPLARFIRAEAELEPDGQQAERQDDAATPDDQLAGKSASDSPAVQLTRFGSEHADNAVDLDHIVGKLQCQARHSRTVQLDFEIARVSVGDPRICGAVQFASREVALVGKRNGGTHVTFWPRQADQTPATYEVRIGPAVDEARQLAEEYSKLAELIADVFPGCDISLLPGNNNTIVVRGTAETQDQARQILTMIRNARPIPVVDEVRVE